MHKNYNIACIAQRETLLDNGFIPLPLEDKRPSYRGWTAKDLVTKQWLESFRRKTKYSNTGLRCDNLIAMDIDVTDADLADAIEHLIEQECGSTELCRIGQWPKRLLLYRADGEAAKSARTGKYGGHMVEMLATRGRQFVVCGIHPITHEPYQWEDEISPATVPYNKLPALAPDVAMATLDKIDVLLSDTGLPLETHPRRLGVDHPDLYDLTETTPCLLIDGTEIAWSELRPTLDETGVMGNLKRENGEFGDSNGVHFYLSDIDEAPVAYDFARDIFHREPPAMEKLADILPEQPVKQDFDPSHLQHLLDNYVLMAEGSGGLARLIDHPYSAYTLAALKNLFAHHTVSVPTARGDKRVPVVQIWSNHPNTKRAHRVALRPDHADELFFVEGKETIFNAFRRRQLPARGGEIDTFFEFMDHLLPDDEAYHLVLGWLAYKFVHPGERMHGLLLVTPSQGTGRGTLAKIMGHLFGHEYVRQTELHNLVGTTGQAVYNDDLADSLIVYVPEAQEFKDNVSQYYQRKGAYEHLKQIIDPISTTVKIKRKYGKNTMERTFASVLISSNHIDALALDKEDRRLIVLDNTRISLNDAPNGLRDRIHAWMREDANIGALARYLIEYAAVESTYNPFDTAPMTDAKLRMIDAGQSDIDVLYDTYVVEADGDLCTQNQLVRFIEQRARDENLDIPDGTSLKTVVRNLLRVHASRLIPNKPNWQIRVNNTRVRPWILRHIDQWSGVTDSTRISAELAKNGPVTLSLVSALPSRRKNNNESTDEV